jgi:hypothetical protein
MVWYQYVWEATTGNEADWSDDENEKIHQEPLHIDDWIDFNSEQLEYLWAIIQEYLDDAVSHVFPTMRFEDFARFCHEPPMCVDGVFDTEFWIDRHSEELTYIWKLLKRTKSFLLYRTTYEEFTQFCYASR